MPKASARSDQLLTFFAEFGRAYLASGGPTSRLEELLSSLGNRLGIASEIFATPTGIFVSCTDEDGGARTTLRRIKDSGIDLDRLCWLEKVYEDLYNGKLDVEDCQKRLERKGRAKPLYPLWQTIGAAFLSGFSLSFSTYRGWFEALVSGLIATITWWLAGPGLKSRISSSIFRDFIGCVAVLGLASVAQMFLPSSFDAYTIGGIIMLVPGLALTSAISELADQNLVSGTAKLMQAMLTLLALGMAYLLFYDLSESMELNALGVGGKKRAELSIAITGLVVSVTCFGVILKVPKRLLFWSSLTGLVGWLMLRQFSNLDYIVAASYLASLCVGLLSLTLSKWYRMPSQVFSAPGIIAMLPGVLALNSFSSFALGNQKYGLETAFRVAITAGAIVFGLFTARIPFALKFPRYRQSL